MRRWTNTAGAMVAAGAALAASFLAAVGAAPRAGAQPGSGGQVHVSPVPGDRFAPVGTEITFRDVSPSALAHLTVVGSKSGAHTGAVRAIPGEGAVFVPAHPFAGGELVTVRSPGMRLAGGSGDSYVFGTATPPTASAAAAALRAVQTPPAATTANNFDPPACPLTTYRSAPDLHAQSACMNVGVTTAGTQPGSYLFMTPSNGPGAGIWDDRGNLVWWQSGNGSGTFNPTVVTYQGQSLLAVWTGTPFPLARGVVALYDQHYQSVGQVTAGNGFPSDYVDLHEFQITPQGTALLGIYDPVTVTNQGVSQTVVQFVVQELSLVQDATGIHTGDVLFEWDSLSDVPTSQSVMPDPGPGGTWDYFHGNAVSADTDGNLVLSARNTWGIYKIDATPSDAGFGHVEWVVGASGTPQLVVPWCFQHDIVALGSNEYSLYDDGGVGPGCVPGSTQHQARALIITVDPSTNPVGLTLDQSFTHTPPIFTAFTGSTQVQPNGDVLVGWANVPEVTEYDSTGAVKMDLSLSAASYRALRFAWDGQPLYPPAIAMTSSPGQTSLWASWNGSTEVAAWQVLAGPTADHLAPIGHPAPRTGFETAIVVAGNYQVWAVEALNSQGSVLSVSKPVSNSHYFTTTSAGAVSSGGGSPAYGSATGLRLRAPIVAMVSTPSGHGYWLAARDGGVFSYGDARFFGSAGRVRLVAPIVGMAATPTGRGYWLVASDGGTFSYGDARFFGSAATIRLAAPVVGMAATSTGLGYWLAARDGGVFSYGDARFFGSAGGIRLAAPIVGAAATSTGRGYWLVGSDGGTFSYGDARFFGSAAGLHLPAPIVAMAAVPDAGGYWLAGADGRVGIFQGPQPFWTTVPVPAGSGLTAVAGGRI